MPTRRKRQQIGWILEMRDFTEGTAVSLIRRVTGSASLKVSPALPLEVGTESFQRSVLQPGDPRFGCPQPLRLHTTGHTGCPQIHLPRRCDIRDRTGGCPGAFLSAVGFKQLYK